MMLKALFLFTILALATCRPADEKKVEKVEEKPAVVTEKAAAVKTEEKPKEVVKKVEEVKVEKVKEDKIVADEPKKDMAMDKVEETKKAVETKDDKVVVVKVADAATDVKVEEAAKVEGAETAKDEPTKETEATTTAKPARTGLLSGFRKNAANFASRLNPFNRRRTAENKIAPAKEAEVAKPVEVQLPILPTADKESKQEKRDEMVAASQPEKEQTVKRSITGMVKSVAREMIPVISRVVEAYAESQRPL